MDVSVIFLIQQFRAAPQKSPPGGKEYLMKHIFCRFKQKISSSINAKFLVMFLFLLIIPLIILTQLFIVRLHNVLKAKEQASIDEKIQIAGSQFDRIFSDMDRITTSLILDYHVTDILNNTANVPSYEWFTDFKSMNGLLSLLTTNSDHTFQITVLCSDNRLYRSGALYNAMLTTDAPIFRHVSEGNGRPVIFNRALENYDENEVITFGRSVYQKGNLLGSILVELPAESLNNLLSSFDNDSTRLYVLGENDKIIYSSAPVESAIAPSELIEVLYSGESTVSLDKTSYLFRRMPMRQHPLSIVAMVEEDSVFRESSQVISAYILGFSLLTAATICGILLLTFFYTRNIRTLNDAVSSFGDQTVTQITLPIRSHDEIGQLTQGVISMSHRINRLVSQIRENERNKRILEFNSLQAQINPHMIYNTLNTITYLAEMQNIANIREVSSSFAHLLRSLSNQGEFITIAQETEYLEAFIVIKKYNLLCNVETEFQIDEAAKNCRILKLILQPIVENAIIHGFSNRLEDGLIQIFVRRKEDLILIDISDNGNGMDENRIQKILYGEEKSTNTFLRVGTKNIIERLKLQYADNCTFNIASAPDCGTTVHISFPAEEMEENSEFCIKEGTTNAANPVG